MKQYIKSTTEAAGIRKALKCYGIEVLRCAQNKTGVLLTVKKSSEEKAIKFLAEFDLRQQPNMPAAILSKGVNYIDFGTVFYYKEIASA